MRNFMHSWVLPTLYLFPRSLDMTEKPQQIVGVYPLLVPIIYMVKRLQTSAAWS